MGCAWLGATAGAKQRQGVPSTVPVPSESSASFEVPIALPTASRVPATARSRRVPSKVWPRAAGVAGEVGGEGVEEVRLGVVGG
jgi:hypothetical protein